MRCLDKLATAAAEFDPLAPDPAKAAVPHRLFNIGNSQPVPLLRFITLLEQAMGRKAPQQLEPMQPGDVETTAATTSALEEWVGFSPWTPLGGVVRFAAWYRS